MFSRYHMALQGVRFLLEVGQVIVVNHVHLANTNVVLHHVVGIWSNAFLIARHPVLCSIYGVSRVWMAVANECYGHMPICIWLVIKCNHGVVFR